ncbi:MAG: M42 family metallopeptidase [bacterium JZ-2024 1]
MEDVLWKEVLYAWGVSGFEEPVRQLLQEKISAYGEVHVDKVGNLWLIMKGKNPEKRKVAFVAHMDEIGFVLTHITEKGRAKFKKIGGIDDRILPSQKVEVRTRSGEVIPGIIGIKPPHLTDPQEQQRVIPASELEIFFGFSDAKEAEEAGLEILLPARFQKEILRMNEKFLCCRGLDDRAGCFVLLRLAQELSRAEFSGTLYFIWTVQEEYGLRGARALSRWEFDESYIVDTISFSPGGEVSGVSPIEIGKGFVFRVIDRLGIASYPLYEKARRLAEQFSLPFQIAVAAGTTDATALFEGGSPSLPLGIPLGFSHSSVEVLHTDDVRHTISLCFHLAIA